MSTDTPPSASVDGAVSSAARRWRLPFLLFLLAVSAPAAYWFGIRYDQSRLRHMDLAMLQKEADRRVDEPEVYVMLGRRRRQARDREGALAAVQHAYNLRSDASTAALLALIQLDMNLIGPARRTLDEALKAWPRSSEVLAQTANFDLKLGHTGEALEGARRAARGGSDSPEVFRVLGRASFAAKQPEEAWKAFERATALAPEDAEIASDYGEALSRYGNAPRAESILRRAVLLAPQSPRTLGLLGSHLAAHAGGSAQRQEAILLLQKAIALAPMASAPRYHVGSALLREGRAREAIPHLRKCLELESELGEAHLLLAQAYIELHRSPEADKEFAAFEAFNRFNHDAVELQLRLSQQPKNRDLLLRMARLQDKNGFRRGAAKYYREALELHDDPALRRKLESLER